MKDITDTFAFYSYSRTIINSLRSKKAIKLSKRDYVLNRDEEQITNLSNEILTYLFNYQNSNPDKFINITFEVRVLRTLLRYQRNLSPKITSRISSIASKLDMAGRGRLCLDEVTHELNSLTAMLRRRDRQIRRLNYNRQGNEQIIEARTIRCQLLNEMYVEYVVSSILEGDTINECLIESIVDAMKGHHGNVKYAIFLLSVIHYSSSASAKFSKWSQEITNRRYQSYIGVNGTMAYKKAMLEIDDLFFSYFPPLWVITDVAKRVKICVD